MIKKILKWTVVLLVVVVGSTAAWMSIPFPYQQQQTADALVSNDQVEVNQHDFIEFVPKQGASKGLIVYPGGKTTAETFAPLAQQFASHGIYVAIMPMPLNTAFLGIDKANIAIEQRSDISTWYVAGHSLGGVAAAEYAKSAEQSIAGLILWASYPGSDISGLQLPVISISAEKDLQTTPEKIALNKAKMPNSAIYEEISNGNHWHFAHYQDAMTEQQGLLTRQQQQQKVVELSLQFML